MIYIYIYIAGLSLLTCRCSFQSIIVSNRGTVVISPTNGSFNIGDDVSLTCSGMGGPRNMFRWYRNDTELLGQNDATLTLVNITVDDGDEYMCVITNAAGSSNTTTFVFVNPTITEHPVDTTATSGANATLECLAEAFPDPSYEWTYSNGSNIELSSVVGTSTRTLQFLPAEFGSEGSYVCVASANNATATSDVAILFSKSLKCIFN